MKSIVSSQWPVVEEEKWHIYLDWLLSTLFSFLFSDKHRSRIHECTISLRFLGIILRVLRLEVYPYNVCFIPLFSLVEVTVNKEENSSDFCPNYVQEFGIWIGTAFPCVCVFVTRPNLQTWKRKKQHYLVIHAAQLIILHRFTQFIYFYVWRICVCNQDIFIQITYIFMSEKYTVCTQKDIYVYSRRCSLRNKNIYICTDITVPLISLCSTCQREKV